MAHLLETMTHGGATPWHSLEHRLTAGQSIDALGAAGGHELANPGAPVRFMTESGDNLDAMISFSENKVLFRSDTHAPLAVVSHRYKAVQRGTFWSFIVP